MYYSRWIIRLSVIIEIFVVQPRQGKNTDTSGPTIRSTTTEFSICWSRKYVFIHPVHYHISRWCRHGADQENDKCRFSQYATTL